MAAPRRVWLPPTKPNLRGPGSGLGGGDGGDAGQDRVGDDEDDSEYGQRGAEDAQAGQAGRGGQPGAAGRGRADLPGDDVLGTAVADAVGGEADRGREHAGEGGA